MPSSTVCLILCFMSWLCAQVYTSFRLSIHVQIHYVEVPAAADSIFSLDAVIGVLIYTVALVLVMTCILDTRKCDCQAFLKTVVAAAAADCTVIPRRRTLLLLPPIPPRTPPAAPHGIRLPPMTFPIPRPLWLSHIVFPRRSQLLLLPPPPPSLATLPAHISFPLRRMVFSIPRPFWRPTVLYRPQITVFVPTALPPVIELPTALALVTKGVTTRLPFVSLITGGRNKIQDLKPSFIRLYCLDTGILLTGLELGTTSKSRPSICGASIEENVDEKTDDTFVCLAGAEDIHPPLVEDRLATGRQSHAHFLRHVAAAALLRRLRRVIEEPCCASIEEVVEDEDGVEEVETEAIEEVKVVEQLEAVGKPENNEAIGDIEETVEQVGDVAEAAEDAENIIEKVAEIEKADEGMQVKVAEKVEGVEEPIEEAGKIVEKGIEEIEQAEVEVGAVEPAEKMIEFVALQEIEKAVEEPEKTAEDTAQTLVAGAEPSLTTPEEKKVEVEKKTAAATYDDISGPALYEELDLPSYEEFVEGAPPEPLFEKRNPDVVDYVVIRPPPLAYYVSRTGVKSCSTRVSRLPLLARLSSRISAPIAESIQA